MEFFCFLSEWERQSRGGSRLVVRVECLKGVFGRGVGIGVIVSFFYSILYILVYKKYFLLNEYFEFFFFQNSLFRVYGGYFNYK